MKTQLSEMDKLFLETILSEESQYEGIHNYMEKEYAKKHTELPELNFYEIDYSSSNEQDFLKRLYLRYCRVINFLRLLNEGGTDTIFNKGKED